MVAMSKRNPSKKSLPAAIGGVLLVLVAGYFGLDLNGNGSSGNGGNASDEPRPSAQPSTDNNASGDNSQTEGTSGLDTCSLSSLPEQATVVADTILAGGPYEHPDNDNKRFGNYEGVLPDEKLGYYREYTVETPGLGHRGERRIVTGGGTETDPDVWYYTDDHYESFCEIPDAEK